MDSVDLGSLTELDDLEHGLAFDDLLADETPGAPPDNVSGKRGLRRGHNVYCFVGRPRL